MAGYIGSQRVSSPAASLEFSGFGNNFGAATLTAMDGAHLEISRRLLLTLVGKVENQGMKWNAQRTSVGSNWGHGPTIAEGIPANISIKVSAERHVWALDGAGKRTAPVPATMSGGELSFTVGPQYHTLWYEIAEK